MSKKKNYKMEAFKHTIPLAKRNFLILFFFLFSCPVTVFFYIMYQSFWLALKFAFWHYYNIAFKCHLLSFEYYIKVFFWKYGGFFCSH